MKILVIGTPVGLDDVPDGAWTGFSVPTTDYHFCDALADLGHEVAAWNPRQTEHCPFYMDGTDLIIMNANVSDGVNLETLRAPIAVWYGDGYDGLNPRVVRAARYADWLFHTTGGPRLEQYKDYCEFRAAAFIPMPAHEVPQPKEKNIDWFFSGTSGNRGDLLDQRVSDVEILKELVGDALLHPGMFGMPPVSGRDHYEMMRRAKRGIAINRWFARATKYMSSRSVNYMSAGMMLVHRDFEGADIMLPPEVEVYSDRETLMDAVKRAGGNVGHGARIRAWALEHYDPKVIVQYMLDVASGRAPEDVRWKEVY